MILKHIQHYFVEKEEKCAICGGKLEKTDIKQGPVPKYCSEICKLVVKNERQMAWQKRFQQQNGK